MVNKKRRAICVFLFNVLHFFFLIFIDSNPFIVMRKCLIIIFLLSFQMTAWSQDLFYAGIRAQKTVNLYFENGIVLGYGSESLLNGKTIFGVKYVTSRLGSALGSNAIKQDNVLLYGSYLFRETNKYLNVFTDLNMGYFHASYGSDIFSELPNNSLMISIEPGIRYKLYDEFDASASFGYNLLTGNGETRPGTLYPLFVQLSLQFKFIKQ